MKKKFLLDESYIPKAGDEILYVGMYYKQVIVIDIKEAIQLAETYVNLHMCHSRDDFLYYCKQINSRGITQIGWENIQIKSKFDKYYYLRDIKRSRLDFE